MGRRLVPIGNHRCLICEERIIPSHELACQWCKRAHPGRVEWLVEQFPRFRFIVPIVLSPNSDSKRKAIFRSLVSENYRKSGGRLLEGALRLEVLSFVGHRTEAVKILGEVMTALKHVAYTYPEQVEQVIFAQAPVSSGATRSEMVVGRLPVVARSAGRR